MVVKNKSKTQPEQSSGVYLSIIERVFGPRLSVSAAKLRGMDPDEESNWIFAFFAFFWAYFKMNIESAMEYRFNFIAQTLAMFMNDVVWIIFWLIFFTKFQSVSGWTFNDMITLYAFLTISWGFTGTLFGNKREIANIVAEGKLDFYLALPKNELFHLLISKMKYYDFGDFLFGIVMMIIGVSLNQMPLFLLLCFLSSMIVLHFTILVGSLAFFMGNAEELSYHSTMGLLAFATYPITIFTGPVKIIMMTLIPAGFVTGVPVMLMRDFNFQMFGWMLLFTVIISLLAWGMFYIGLRRYESGNLINVRM